MCPVESRLASRRSSPSRVSHEAFLGVASGAAAISSKKSGSEGAMSTKTGALTSNPVPRASAMIEPHVLSGQDNRSVAPSSADVRISSRTALRSGWLFSIYGDRRFDPADSTSGGRQFPTQFRHSPRPANCDRPRTKAGKSEPATNRKPHGSCARPILVVRWCALIKEPRK